MKITKQKLRKLIRESIIKEIGLGDVLDAVKSNLPVPTDVKGALKYLIDAPEAKPDGHTLEIDYGAVAHDLGMSPEEVVADMEEGAMQTPDGPVESADVDSTNQYVAWRGSPEELAALLATFSSRGIEVSEENMELVG